MDVPRSLSRRRLLRSYGAVVTLGTLAGCVGGGEGDSEEGQEDDAEEGRDAEAEEGESGDSQDGGDVASGEAGDSGGLDLREANVVGVEFDRQGGAYRFEVALHHDDEGEEGYANWWQVERRDGTRLGRRDLLHAHAQQPFTRSETVEIPNEVDCVIIRGHDQTHGYGGQAATVSLASEETRLVDQGPESRSFDAGDCPD